MSGKKVLYLLPNSRKGGAEQLTGWMIQGHAPGRWKGEAFFFEEGPLVDEWRGLGIRCHVSGLGGRPRLRKPQDLVSRSREIARLLRAERFDLIHSAMGYAHLFGGIAALGAGIRSVWFQHGPCGPMDWATGRIPADLLLVNSRFTLERQARYYAWAKRTQILYPGLETPRVSATAAAEARSALGIASGEIVFGLFGRVTPLKGQLEFCQAIAKLRASGVRARGLVVGSPFMGGDDAYLAQVQAALGEGVTMRPHLADPLPLMGACDAVANASVRPEALGLTLLEGMALGKPVIGPRLGGVPEVIEHGTSGLLFEGQAGLIEALGRLAVSPELRAEMGARARARFEDRFARERMMRELEEGYDRALR